MLDNLSGREETIDLIGPSGEEQFQRGEYSLGTAHLLNIFATDDGEWSERERIEFSVKVYVYLSKLHKREPYDRFILADCSGSEPLISSNLSVLAPTWVNIPLEIKSERGQAGSELLQTAERRFSMNDLGVNSFRSSWPPETEQAEILLDRLLS
jgi:hypothetical protein